ncbi:peptidyl-prolyl cis-trans isomerase 1-like [Bicyclus anynana]|uniref:Peptidyl-prolyl cis-trans isomerase 1-like n=1 Tax=Bicyclus anynana TaxID=110368 RepID=A0A6J1NMY9_BICAN|nr:peptidyl-prolyl cis-trans isomerase 1-like [Bicyclus anynana]
MLALSKEGFQVPARSHHPWHKTIKDVHSNNFKIAHNSVNNPQYPKKDLAPDNKNRTRFTIIGDRVNKNFIQCVNLVKELHKYRRKIFDAPIIKGLTTVEWPKAWNDLKLQYGGIAYCLQNPVAVLINDKFLGGDEELKEMIESRYDYHFNLNYFQEGVDSFVNYIRSSGRPCAYMHISINYEHTGTLIFMLYADIVPYTCENFLRLCECKRGGYAGTPVHRIVKDGWIQCGGFGLKSTDLNCENFIVPHDRRGVLCMANEARDVDCSTQFFVLLQPAPWMANKYVAFGQLIEGESTLKDIESVPTFYESPTSAIKIEKAGVLNLECHGIRVSKSTNEYIQGHVEDLNALGDLLAEQLIEKVFLELEFKHVKQLEMEMGEAEESDGHKGEERVHATARFIRRKEDLENLQKNQTHTSRTSSAVSDAKVNNDFDVDEYEPEEYSYHHASVAATVSVVVKPEIPYYLPLTDVPYPDEKDSTYDLKKFLRGDYCLESDLKNVKINKVIGPNVSYVSAIYKLNGESENESIKSLSSDDEQEIRRYLKLNVDRVSFAGSVVKSIARGGARMNVFNGSRNYDFITDEELRRYRLASMDRRSRDDKKVSICSTTSRTKVPGKIKRRQTGFVRPADLEKIYLIRQNIMEEEESTSSMTASRKVRISIKNTPQMHNPKQRKTVDSDTQVRRQSALSRLYDDMTDYTDMAEEGPTLKSPTIKVSDRKFMLTQSPMSRIRHSSNGNNSSEDLSKEQHLRHSVTMKETSIEEVLNLQHNKKFARKVSSDYVKTIDEIEHKVDSSIRTIEFARRRPSMSVAAYQQKNLKYQAEIKKQGLSSDSNIGGLRLPGDTPLYSMTEVESHKNLDQ